MKLRKFLKKIYIDFKYAYLTRLYKSGSYPVKKFTLGEIHFELFPAKNADIIFYGACDNFYFKKYARSFASSFLKNCTNGCVHIHIYNPTKETFLAAQEFQSYFAAFSWSYDHTDISKLTPLGVRRYYYSARFVRMEELMKICDKPCICVDIDALCANSPNDLIRHLVKNDIAFFSRFSKFGPDTKLLAGTLFANNTKAGLSFISAVSNRILYITERGFHFDKMDQVVIYKCFLTLKRLFPKVRFFNICYPYIDKNFTDRGIIWYPKGSTQNNSKYLNAVKNARA